MNVERISRERFGRRTVLGRFPWLVGAAAVALSAGAAGCGAEELGADTAALAAKPGDRDGDGKTDLFCQDVVSGDLTIATSTSGYVAPQTSELTAFCGREGVLGTGDFDGDGILDFSCRRLSGDTMTIRFMNAGNTSYQDVWFTFCAGYHTVFGTGDFDHDGKTDLYCRSEAPNAAWSDWT